MSDYERRRKAVEETAKQIKDSSKGRITSEQAHREALKIANRVNRKKDEKR